MFAFLCSLASPMGCCPFRTLSLFLHMHARMPVCLRSSALVCGEMPACLSIGPYIHAYVCQICPWLNLIGKNAHCFGHAPQSLGHLQPSLCVLSFVPPLGLEVPWRTCRLADVPTVTGFNPRIMSAGASSWSTATSLSGSPPNTCAT
jgi:hypothetical protein